MIDQLDAVSDYSGRMPLSFSAIDELVRQAITLQNVQMLLAVFESPVCLRPRDPVHGQLSAAED